MSKHTPGPWHTDYAECADAPGMIEIRADDMLVGAAVLSTDARLIAAAPELAAALWGLLSTSALNEESQEPEDEAAIVRAHAALAKAGV